MQKSCFSRQTYFRLHIKNKNFDQIVNGRHDMSSTVNQKTKHFLSKKN